MSDSQSYGRGVRVLYVLYSWIFVLIVFGIVLSQIILLQNFNDHLPRSKGVLDYIQENLSQNPINEIIIQADGSCQNSEKVLLYIWPGIRDGCYCEAQNSLVLGICSTQTCTTIKSKQLEILYEWNNKVICVRRAKDFQYLNPVEQQSCKQGYQKCSDFICVPSSEKCPINYIQVINKVTAPTTDVIQGFSSTQDLRVIRNAKYPPISEISVTIPQLPCFDSDLKPKRNYYFGAYPLLREIEAGCGEYGTAEFHTQIISYQKESEFYVDNMGETFLSEMNFYKEYLDSGRAYLISKNKIIPKQGEIACQQINLRDYDELIKYKQKYQNSVFGFLLAANISSFILFLWIVIYIIIALIRRELFLGQQPTIINVLTLLLDFYILAMCSHEQRLYLNDYNKYRNNFGQYVEANCFNYQQANKAVSDVIDFIPGQLTAIIVLHDILLGFASASLFIFIIIFLLMFKVHKNRKNLDYDEDNDYIELTEKARQGYAKPIPQPNYPVPTDYINRSRTMQK